MSSAKIILLGELGESVQAIPTAVYFLKLARRSGHLSLERTFYLGDLKVRVLLDPYAGDKVYIEPVPCQAIKFSGLLDTYRAKLRSPLVTPRYLIDDQLKMEYRLPLNSTAPVPTAKLLYGVRPKDVTAVIVDELAGDIAPVATQGYDGDLYTVVGTNDVYLKELQSWRLLEQVVENPRLTTELPVEATTVTYFDSLGDPLDPPVADIDYSKFKETYQALFPSRFTGHMRKVAQATFASEAWVNFATTLDANGNPVAPAAPVNYVHGDSWGCIKNGSRYHFIQITSDSVYLVPSKYCTHLDSTTGEDIVVLRSAEVSSRVKIGTIPAGLGSSWDNEIGWAFSYTAAEASIVYSSTTQIGADSYVTVSLLTLTFGLDVNGTPNLATLSTTPPEIMYHPVFMNKSFDAGGHALFNVVTKGSDGQPENRTVDFGLQRLGYPTPPNYKAHEIPVYVYYTSAGRQLCTYDYIAEAGSTRVTTKPPSREFYTWDPYDWRFDSTYRHYDESAALAQRIWGTWVTTGHVDWGFSCNGSSRPHSGGTTSVTTTEYVMDGTSYVADNGVAGWAAASYLSVTYQRSDNLGVSWYEWTDYWGWSSMTSLKNKAMVIATSKSGGNTIIPEGSLTLPVNDRESALIFASSYTAAASGTETTTISTATPYDSGACRESLTPAENSRAYTTPVTSQMEFAFKIGKSLDCPPPYWVKDMVYNVSRIDYMVWADTSEALRYAVVFDTSNTYFSGNDLYCDGPFTSACGTSYYQYYNNHATFIENAPPARSLAVPATSTSKLTLHSHNPPLNLPVPAQVDKLYSPTPQSGFVLAYEFVQAAFEPANTITYSAGLNSALVAKMGGSTYDVKNKLYGWIGVV